MKTNVASDCSNITITSNILAEYASASPSINYTSVKLEWSINTEDDTYTSYTVDVADISTDTMTLDPTFFGSTDSTLSDGIYCFKLIGTTDSQVDVEFGSEFVYCGLICELAAKVWNDPTDKYYSKFEAIKYQTQCSSCDCSTTTDMYNELLCDLGIDPEKDCGC